MIQNPAQFLVVGIGASAGGVDALQTFFANVPAGSGCAYMVILHLSPEHDSQLPAILQAVTELPVTPVTEAVRVEPNHVYVVPQGQHLTMIDGEVHVSPNLLPEARRAPIDIFFRTLAESHHDRGVCVILSGTGADGSMGLKRVKERGGAVFVQNPREAAFNEMPRSAIATDLVDAVLPVADIPARIVAYRASLGTVAIHAEPEQRPEAQQQALREVFALLRARTGHDFANYKRATVLRRLERRITVRDLPDLEAYASFLRDHPDEVQALLNDLLISVTNFFRDPAAFAALEQDILPRLFHGKASDAQVRLWVVGCATGEEAYSLAMLCAELTFDVIDAPSFQVFASDIDEAAIARAREGLYTTSDLADVSPERLRRFFTHEDGRYRVRPELRETVLFANHNILKDPPFSHIDLVSCRNVLIYLNHTAQERVMETLHFALNPGGYLFLGTAESADGTSDLFATANRDQHIFQHRPVGTRPLPLPDSVPVLRASPPRVPALELEPPERTRARIGGNELHQQLLEQYAPPSIVVSQEFAVIHVSERAGRYLQLSGEFSADLVQLVRPELRLELRSALNQAMERRTNVDTSPLPVRVEGRAELVTIRVRPVFRADDPEKAALLVLFEAGATPPSESAVLVRADEPATRQLEEENARLRRQLRTSSEQYEYQAEELRATNEELQALNEELRSSAEELETSKEELQSINEELRTVNQELKVKVDEATLHSANLQNLVNSTDIATIFLDRQLRVRLFTPAARALFHLIPADYGRPLSDLTHQLREVNVLADAETVLATLLPVEREVGTTDGRAYVLRALPYRAAEDRIGGVVLTFFDITARKLAEEAVRGSEEQFRRAIEEAPIPVIMHAEDGEVLQISRSWTELTGYTLADVPTFDAWLTRAYGQGADTLRDHIHALFAGKQRSLNVAFEIRPRAGELRHWSFSASMPGRLRDGRRFVVGMALDITERTRAERTLAEQARLLDLSNDAIIVRDVDNRIVFWNHGASDTYGWTRAEAVGQDLHTLLHTEFEMPFAQLIAVLQEQDRMAGEVVQVTRDGRRLTLLCRWALDRDAAGQPGAILTTTNDISERKRMEQALRELNATLAERVDAQTAVLREREEHLRATNAELVQALRLKDEFLAMMSHELRTPLNVILGFTEALTEEIYGPILARQREALSSVEQSGRHLLALLSDILDVARIASGHEILARQPIDVRLLCQAALRFVLPAAQARGIQLRHTVEPSISGLQADQRRLTQILVNLLGNAVKFTPEGGTVGLEVSVDAAQEHIQFSVWDTGIGISAADQTRLFEPFTQLDGRLSRQYEGVGLGLALVRQLVDLHDGSISLASTLGQGSRFTVSLPWAADNLAPSVVRPPEILAPDWAQPPQVLLADDHEPTLQLYADLLRQRGCKVTIARTGEQALAQVRATRPDVAVLDIQMPDMNGLTAIRQIRADPALASLPIIALTALAMPGDRERCLEAGANTYLSKPVGVRTLVASIAEVLSRADAGAP